MPQDKNGRHQQSDGNNSSADFAQNRFHCPVWGYFWVLRELRVYGLHHYYGIIYYHSNCQNKGKQRDEVNGESEELHGDKKRQ